MEANMIAADAAVTSAEALYDYVMENHRSDYVLRQLAYKAMADRICELNRLRYQGDQWKIVWGIDEED